MNQRPDRTTANDEDMVALVVAWELLSAARPVPDETVPATPPWRFSGRWFDSSRRVV